MKHSLSIALLGALVLSTACSDSSDDPEVVGGLFVAPSQRLPHAVASGAEVVAGERWSVYLASETEGGVDLNLDGDTMDRVAIAHDGRNNTTYPLAASLRVELLEENVYMVVDEAEDGVDWSGDMDTDETVLLHWSLSSGVTTFLASVGRTSIATYDDERLYFTIDPTLPPVPDESRLCYIRETQPTTLFAVFVQPGAGLDPEVLAVDEGLMFLLQDEEDEGADLNGDGDQTDEVLALLDTTSTGNRIRNVGLAVDDDAPVRANGVAGETDWVVAFLVSEEDQGATNLNHPTLFDVEWQPTHCAGFNDTDTDDEVLHYLMFADWDADPVTTPPVNTGLVGDDRLFVLENSGRYVVGTLSDEDDEGSCSLNGDGDRDDDVLRWGEALPTSFDVHTELDNMVAIADVAGGFEGVAEVSRRIVAVISESDDERDWDGFTAIRDVIAWIDPFDGDTAEWTAVTRSSNGTPLGAAWFVEDPTKGGFLCGDEEERIGFACNSGDTDTDDVFAVAARFAPGAADEVEWTGYCYAAESFNVGMVVLGNSAFFRASEAEQGRDINEDGDETDMVLLRHSIFPLGRLYFVDVLNNLLEPAVVRGDERVVFFVDEAMAGEDRNGDGDMLDLVPSSISVDD